MLITALVLWIVQEESTSGGTRLIGYVVMSIAALVGFLYLICLARQRANDISERYALLFTLLILIFPWGLLLAVQKGQPTSNRYGPPAGQSS
jgi:uncharacterized membrane protein YhaH (DUF805 family)